MRETWVQSLGREDAREKAKATHSSILAWRMPWTVQSMGFQRVGHNWVTFTCPRGSQVQKIGPKNKTLDVMAGGLSFRLRCRIGASLTLVALQWWEPVSNHVWALGMLKLLYQDLWLLRWRGDWLKGQICLQGPAGADNIAVCVGCSVVSDPVTPRTVAPRLLCPWDSPGKSTGVRCHFLLQGIFPTQGWNSCFLWLLRWQQILYQWAAWEAQHCCGNPVTCSSPVSSPVDTLLPLTVVGEDRQILMALLGRSSCNVVVCPPAVLTPGCQPPGSWVCRLQPAFRASPMSCLPFLKSSQNRALRLSTGHFWVRNFVFRKLPL